MHNLQKQNKYRNKRNRHGHMSIRNSTTGFTLIEIIIVISIAALVMALSFSAFSRFNKRQELNVAVSNIKSILEEARSLTLASKNDAVHGVHFESSQVTLFAGGTFSSSDPNNDVTKLSERVVVSEILLTGGSDDVIFDRITGKTGQAGSIVVAFASDLSASITITIYVTGIIE